MFPMDPIIALMAVARETKHIGLVATLSTTFNYPYNIARQFKALDVISHGRVGWNAVILIRSIRRSKFWYSDCQYKNDMAWLMNPFKLSKHCGGVGKPDAWTLDVEGGKFADMDKIKPINLEGQYYASRGPLPIPLLSKVSQLFSKQVVGVKDWN